MFQAGIITSVSKTTHEPAWPFYISETLAIPMYTGARTRVIVGIQTTPNKVGPLPWFNALLLARNGIDNTNLANVSLLLPCRRSALFRLDPDPIALLTQVTFLDRMWLLGSQAQCNRHRFSTSIGHLLNRRFDRRLEKKLARTLYPQMVRDATGRSTISVGVYYFVREVGGRWVLGTHPVKQDCKFPRREPLDAVEQAIGIYCRPSLFSPQGKLQISVGAVFI